MNCSSCKNDNKCSAVKKFINVHKLSMKNSSELINTGLCELYDSKIVNKAFSLLERARHINGYLYAFKTSMSIVYLKKDEIPELILTKFLYNEDSRYFEYPQEQ